MTRAELSRRNWMMRRFQKAFYKVDEHVYASGSQTALAMPLALRIAPEPERAALLEKRIGSIRGAGDHTTAGDIGYHYVISALLDAAEATSSLTWQRRRLRRVMPHK